MSIRFVKRQVLLGAHSCDRLPRSAIRFRSVTCREVSAAHEQEVRDRILAAAARVFAEKGYHSSTIADVVRESGLSVGAIYTHFSGKDELIRLTCDQLAARGLDELAARLARADTTAERLAIALRLYVETIDEYDGAPGPGHTRPGVGRGRPRAWCPRDARRTSGAAGRGRAFDPAPGRRPGELPSSLDVDAVTRGVLALLDGLMLQRIEAGDAYRPADLERRAQARS